MSKKLLLADDSVTVQRVIELTFADEGLDVVSVGDGATAITCAERDRPDIILADISMPERDGYEVAEYVKTTPHLAHIPVVLMTGAFEQVDESRASLVRCNAVLAKPFEPHMVIALVNQLLRGETPERPASTDAFRSARLEPEPMSPAPAAVSLDDYLDRIDDALTAAGAPVTGRSLSASPGSGTPAPQIVAQPVAVASPAPASASSSAPVPSLADAFSVLLAEELGETALPASWGAVTGAVKSHQQWAPQSVSLPAVSDVPAISDALVNEIARRVAERLADNAIQELVSRHVLEVAERLVREEIERIKATAG